MGCLGTAEGRGAWGGALVRHPAHELKIKIERDGRNDSLPQARSKKHAATVEGTDHCPKGGRALRRIHGTRKHNMNAKITAVGALVVLGLSAQAAIVINITEVGSDVYLQGSGSVNTTSLTVFNSPFTFNRLIPNMGAAGTGAYSPSVQTYWYQNAATGPSSFGTGALADPTSGSGDRFLLFGSTGSIFVPVGYTSGAPLSGDATWANQTLSSLGLTPGTYVWNFGTGANADTWTVNITAVPEPHQYAMAAGLGLVGLGLWRRHARK